MQVPPDYLSMKQVCELLGVTRNTVHRWMRIGLPSHQPSGPGGRRVFKRSELDDWIDAGCSPRAAGERAS